jgi:hypothetical protein
MVIIGDSIVGFREWSLPYNGLMNLNHGLDLLTKLEFVQWYTPTSCAPIMRLQEECWCFLHYLYLHNLCWSSSSDWVFVIGSEEVDWRVEREWEEQGGGRYKRRTQLSNWCHCRYKIHNTPTLTAKKQINQGHKTKHHQTSTQLHQSRHG